MLQKSRETLAEIASVETMFALVVASANNNHFSLRNKCCLQAHVVSATVERKAYRIY